MPYTRDQLTQALRSAHDAGDTDAATAIAKQIQQLDAGAGASPTSTSAAGSAAASASSQPTFTQRVLHGLAGAPQTYADMVRIGANAFSGGQADRLAGTMPTWLGGTGKTVEQEQAETNAAWQRHPYLGWVPQIAGVGAAFEALPGGSGIMPSAAKGATYTGVSDIGSGKSAPQQLTEMGESGLVSGALAPIAKVASNIGSRISAALPDFATGAETPKVPTAADLRSGTSFKSNDVYRRADVMDDLAEIQRRASIPGQPGIKQQVSDYIANPDKWNNLTGSEQQSLVNVAGAGPLSAAVTKNPYYLHHGVSSITEPLIIGESEGGGGGVVKGIATGVGGLTAQIIAKMGANALQKQATGAAFDEANRVLGGTPSTPSPFTEWMKAQGPNALHNILFGGYQGMAPGDISQFTQ